MHDQSPVQIPHGAERAFGIDAVGAVVVSEDQVLLQGEDCFLDVFSFAEEANH
jgi:hypothetical protein